MDTSAEYLGMTLKSPIIVGSCGLTGNRDNLLRMQDAGAGAVILTPKFEEEFACDIKHNTTTLAHTDIYGKSYKYVELQRSQTKMDDYFAEVQRIAEALDIPVVGSISCISFEAWINYVKRYEIAGCKAIELIMAIRPYDLITSSQDVERVYMQVLQTTRRVTKLPLTIKVGPYFTDMARFIQKLSWSGVNDITLFDNDLSLAVDVENISITPLPMEHQVEDLDSMIRWLMVLSNRIRGGISAAVGIDNSDDVVKAMLAGAHTVQVTSTLYRHGIEHLSTLNHGLAQWMQRHNFQTIKDFIGLLSIKGIDNAAELMRTNSIKALFDELYNEE